MNNFIIYEDKHYKMAFKEVLVILNYIPKSDYEKIPYDVIQTLKNNADDSYDFSLDIEKNINEQKISELAKAIIENFYIDYWVTNAERKKILQEENLIREKIEEEKRKKYSTNDLFKHKNNERNNKSESKMIDEKYARAYTEVLEIISHFSSDEYSKIPKEKIDFYKEKMDKSYEYKIDPEIDLSKQNISKETNVIIISLFRDYFATEKQKEILNELLTQNQIELEEKKRKKYNCDNIFKNKTKKVIVHKLKKENEKIEQLQLVKYEESFFVKLKNFIFRVFNKK